MYMGKVMGCGQRKNKRHVISEEEKVGVSLHNKYKVFFVYPAGITEDKQVSLVTGAECQ